MHIHFYNCIWPNKVEDYLMVQTIQPARGWTKTNTHHHYAPFEIQNTLIQLHQNKHAFQGHGFVDGPRKGG